MTLISFGTLTLDSERRSLLVGQQDFLLDWNISEFQSPAVDALKVAVDHRIGGVLVFWSPFSTGKTTALKDMVRSMQLDGRTAIYLDAARRTEQNYQRFADWLSDHLGIPSNVQYDDHFKTRQSGNRTVIVIDHFERLLHFPDTSSEVVNLGRISYESRTDHFRIVLAVSRSKLVLQILDWNGKQKLRLACAPEAARWNASYMRRYALSLEEVNALEESEKEGVIRMASEGGSVALVLHLVNLDQSVGQKKLDSEILAWQTGADDLKDLDYYPAPQVRNIAMIDAGSSQPNIHLETVDATMPSSSTCRP